MYQLRIVKSALKEMEELPIKVNREIGKEIEALADNPRPNGCKKLKAEKEYLWRIRVGNYRVIYSIEDVIKIIEIRKVGHRKEIYK
jgi:mRNA interferase RelE/StbE